MRQACGKHKIEDRFSLLSTLTGGTVRTVEVHGLLTVRLLYCTCTSFPASSLVTYNTSCSNKIMSLLACVEMHIATLYDVDNYLLIALL